MLFHQVTAFCGTQGGHQHEEFGLSHSKLIKTEASLNDKSEQVRVDQLLDGIFVYSGCLLGPHGGACPSAVFREKIVLTRNSCLQMARNNLDLVGMAQFIPCCSQITLCLWSGGLQTTCSNEVLPARCIQLHQKVFLFIQ